MYAIQFGVPKLFTLILMAEEIVDPPWLSVATAVSA